MELLGENLESVDDYDPMKVSQFVHQIEFLVASVMLPQHSFCIHTFFKNQKKSKEMVVTETKANIKDKEGSTKLVEESLHQPVLPRVPCTEVELRQPVVVAGCNYTFAVPVVVAETVVAVVVVVVDSSSSTVVAGTEVNSHQPPSSLVIHPRDPSDADNTVKIAIANDTNTSIGSGSGSGIGMGKSHVIESGNLIISVQVLKNVTKNFSHENELVRGGFGVIYKGQLHDGTKIAVKRMEARVISNKASDEFQIWTKFVQVIACPDGKSSGLLSGRSWVRTFWPA
ncbi:hypothetical protein LXL04_027085 [Taraxacum kok-saghyz]